MAEKLASPTHEAEIPKAIESTLQYAREMEGVGGSTLRVSSEIDSASSNPDLTGLPEATVFQAQGDHPAGLDIVGSRVADNKSRTITHNVEVDDHGEVVSGTHWARVERPGGYERTYSGETARRIGHISTTRAVELVNKATFEHRKRVAQPRPSQLAYVRQRLDIR